MHRYLMALTLLLPTALPAQDVEVEVLASTISSWNGSPLPAYAIGDPEITVQKLTIPGHTTLPWHSHPVVSAGVILSGTLTVQTRSGQSLTFTAGDAVVETVDTWHRGINEGSEPVQIIVFTAGIQNEPITVPEPQ